MYDYTPFSMAVGDINSDLKPDVVSVGQNATLSILYNDSKPLTFDSIRHEIAFLPLIRDTTDTKTVTYIPIQDTARFCKRNDYVKRLTVQTHANEYYSGDSLAIRYGTMCSSFCDTVKTAFAFTQRYLLKTVETDSIVNFDTLTTTTSIIYADAHQTGISMDLQSNTCWNISADADWVRPSAHTGSGDAEIIIETDENLKTEPRTATITLFGDRVPPILIPVHQSAAESFVSTPASVIVLSEQVNNTAIIEITSNSNWRVVTDTDWLSFDKTEGTGNGMLTIQGIQNETNLDRIGRIGLNCNGGVANIIPVLQLKKGPNVVVEPSESGIQLYPNPTQGKLIVASDLPMNNTLTLCDLNGLILRSENMSGTKLEMDLGSLQKGVYLIKICTEKKTIVQKIIKQ
jgi:hypothetical protein